MDLFQHPKRALLAQRRIEVISEDVLGLAEKHQDWPQSDLVPMVSSKEMLS